VKEVSGKLRCVDNLGLDGGFVVFCAMKYMVTICFFFLTLWFRFFIDALLICPPLIVFHTICVTLFYTAVTRYMQSLLYHTLLSPLCLISAILRSCKKYIVIWGWTPFSSRNNFVWIILVHRYVRIESCTIAAQYCEQHC